MSNNIIVCAKYDKNDSIIRIVSNIFLDDTEGYEEIDRWIEGEDRYLYAHADNGEYVLQKHGKPLYDENGFPNFYGDFIEWSDEDKKRLYSKTPVISEKEEQENMLQEIMLASIRTTFLINLSDNESIKIPLCYDEWEVDHDYKVGDRVQDDGKLWKCKQEHTSQENWRPSINTASLWEVVQEQHEGTLDDPIPYDMNMEVFKDKYYIENDVVYKCIRNSLQPLYSSCSSLVGNYFELVL